MAVVNQILHRKNSSGTYDIVYLQSNMANVTGTLAVANGGTGATTAADARTNLGAAASSHTHGNITSGGAITATGVTIANGDALTIVDSSASGKLVKSSITFDGSTTTQALTKKGTWATFNNYSHPTTKQCDAASAEIFSKTLTISGWTMGSDGRYKQDVSVTGVTTSTKIITVDVDLTTSDMDAKVEYLTAWAGPSANEVTQGSGKITFYSYELPTVAIPIFVGVCN